MSELDGLLAQAGMHILPGTFKQFWGTCSGCGAKFTYHGTEPYPEGKTVLCPGCDPGPDDKE